MMKTFYRDHLMRQCPICGGFRGSILYPLDFESYEINPLPKHYDVVACCKCGFTYSDMDAAQSDFNTYYTICNMYSEAESLRVADATEEPRLLRVVDIIKDTVPKDSSIIDVGCGGGELLLALKRVGFSNICGLDPSEESITKLRLNGINGILGNIFEEIDYKESFDVVVSTAVIEHIFDLNGYLERLRKLVNNEGYLVLNAPAVEGFPEFMISPANYFNQEHINFFSSVSMDNLLMKYGFLRCIEDPYYIDNGEKQLVSIYKRNDAEEYEITFDTVSKNKIIKYFDLYSSFQEKQDNIIQGIIGSNKKIVIFGTGSFTMQILSKYTELLNRIVFFVDNNTTKQGSLIHGKSIYNPGSLNDITSDILILVCSMRNGNDIKHQLEKMNISNEIIVL